MTSSEWSDGDLARSLGATDPSDVEALRELLDSTESPVSLTLAPTYATDDVSWRICPASEEVERLLAAYAASRRRDT